MLLLLNTPQIASQNNQISPRKALSQTTNPHHQFRDRKGSAFTTTSPNRRRDQDSQIDTTRFVKRCTPYIIMGRDELL